MLTLSTTVGYRLVKLVKSKDSPFVRDMSRSEELCCIRYIDPEKIDNTFAVYWKESCHTGHSRRFLIDLL